MKWILLFVMPLVMAINPKIDKEKCTCKGYPLYGRVQVVDIAPDLRVEIVDILRGASPIPSDWNELITICRILDIKTEEIYPYWENRVMQILSNSGMNLQANLPLITSMFKCAKDYINAGKII